MDFFLSMAWNPEAFDISQLEKYTHRFCMQQFGELYASLAAFILNKYCKYSNRVTPEMMDHKTYNLESGEFKSVRDEFLVLENYALRLFNTLPGEYHNAYKELILFPVQAMANIYDMY